VALAVGTRVDQYEIVAAIGAGGMGEVYRARDVRLRRDVAIKVLPAQAHADPDRLARFEREARAAGGLNHPGILSVFDVGDHEGAPYLVTELLQGASLRERLDAGPMPVRKAVDYAIQLAHALAAAHDAGVVHRDLKPANLFVTRDGRVKILDFGIAKAMEAVTGSGELAATLTAERTSSGAIVGTAGYMAPEQVRGKDADHRADIFAFGVVLHEMISGTAPFAKESAIERAMATLEDDPPPLGPAGREVSPALQLIVRRCLEKDREERFQSARDLAFALKASISASSDVTHAVDLRSGSGRRRQRIALGAVGLAAAGIAFAAGALVGGRTIVERALAPAAAPPPSRPAPLTFERINYRPGWIERARFAPDEQTIVFGARLDGDATPRIFSAVPGNPEPRVLIDRWAYLYDVSRTGDLAFLVREGERLTLVRAPLAGGAPRELVDRAKDAAWGPDGNLVASILGEDTNRLEYPIGTALVQNTSSFNGPWTMVTPTFSPDGAHIAFITAADNNGPSTIDVIDRDRRRRTLVAATGWPLGVAWRSDDELWYTTGDQLRAVRLDGTDRLITELPGVYSLQALAQDGRALLIRRHYTIRIAGRAPGETTERQLGWLEGSIPMGLSDDGRRLLFVEATPEARPGTTETYVRPTDGGPAIDLGPGQPFALSPDGRWALVAPALPATALNMIPTGAGVQHPVALGPIVEIAGARFFPDGNRIAVVGHEAGKPMRIWIADAVGTTPPRPIGPEGMAASAAISPDGKELIGHALPGWDPMVVPVNGGAPRPLAKPCRPEPTTFYARWSGDGRFVYGYARRYSGSLLERTTTFRCELRTGRALPWIDFANVAFDENEGAFAVNVTPDGAGYFYGIERYSSELYLVTGLE